MKMLLSADEVAAQVKRLPPLPRAVHALAEALRSDAVPLERVVEIMRADQALAAAALRLANSSFYGVAGRVSTLRDAVQILGLNMLSAAVMTAAVMDRFDPARCAGFDFEGCWRHAIATALAAQQLALARGLDAEEAYTIGLLHDIGRLALASHFPQAFQASLDLGAREDIPPVVAEKELLGLDHAWVGGWVAEHWRLPAGVVRAVRHHHELPPASSCNLLDVLHLADNVTHALDVSREPCEMVPAMSIGAWERIGATGAELHELFGHVEARMKDVRFGP